MTDFTAFDLAQPILRAIADEGYTTPTPIQTNAIKPLIAGNDLLGIAQTGTGKTAAFALPLLNKLALAPKKAKPRLPQALILAPTRELASQIAESLNAYGRHLGLRVAVIFGGVSAGRQIETLNRGVHILVATPGRLMDLMNQRRVELGQVETLILDEADRMLDMGFIRDVKKIAAATPAQRQTVLFSATMPKDIAQLADELLSDPVRVEITPVATTAERVDQRVLFVAKDKKRALLADLMADKDLKRVLVFTRTKHGADRVARHLSQCGVRADAIHGNKAQNARQRALKDFETGRIRALVATDIASRGIDVDGVTHVVNFDLPNEPESYVHRIGRTARAGATGFAISFCDAEERAYLRDIEKAIRQPVPVDATHAYHAGDIEVANQDAAAPAKRKRSNHRRGNRGSGQRQRRAA